MSLATRRNFVRTLSLLCVIPSILYGKDFSKKQTFPHIGFLSGAGALHLEKAFTEELKKLGFREGEQQFREAAHFVEKILKGAKPGDLPVKHPDKYYLTLNKTAASKIGINLPKELIAGATKFIE